MFEKLWFQLLEQTPKMLMAIIIQWNNTWDLLTLNNFSKKIEADFYGELITFSERRHIHISSGVPKVTGYSVISTSDPNDFFFK